MARITKSQVNDLIELINKKRGIDGDYVPGSVVLGSAYGGYRVEMIVNDAGGVTALTNGYMPLRESYNYLRGVWGALSGKLEVSQ